MAEILEAWMYRDPGEIADELINKSAADQKRAARKKEVDRRNKARRIKKLVKEAMKKGGGK